MILMGKNLVCCLLPYSMLTISKPLNFSTMQLKTFFWISCLLPSFFITVKNFFFASNTFKKYPCYIRALFISKRCSSNLWLSNFCLSLSFKLNNFSYNSVPIASWNYYIDLLFLFFFRNELHNNLHKKMNL